MNFFKHKYFYFYLITLTLTLILFEIGSYLTNLSIPNSVTSINPLSIDPDNNSYADAPFTGTTLNSLTIGDGLVVGSGFGSISHTAFSIMFIGANISNLILGKGITQVYNSSFDNASNIFRSNLKSITFKGKMSGLYSNTFYSVSYPFTNLTEIFFDEFTDSFVMPDDTFTNANYDMKIYIKPKQTLRIFKK